MLRPVEPATVVRSVPAGGRSPRYDVLTWCTGLAAAVALALATFANPSASRIHTWPLSLLVAALWLAPIAFAVIGATRARTWRLPSPVMTAAAAGLVLAALVAALASPFAASSLPRLWPTVGGIAWYLVFHHALTAAAVRETRRRHVARALGWGGAAFVLVSLVQWSGLQWPLPWGGRNPAPFGHSTYTAGAIVLILPWLALRALSTRGVARVAWSLTALAALVTLASTESRGGALACAAVATIAAAVVLRRSRWQARTKLLVLVAMLVVAAGTVLTNSRLRELVLQRAWSETASESNRQRTAMLSAGARLGAERPLLGWGPGTISLAYPRVRAQLDGGTENILQLHNTPAQLWATTGLAGCVALLLLLAGAAQSFARARKDPATLAAASSLFGYGLVALTDHQLDLPFFSLVGATCLAMLTSAPATAGRDIAPPKPLRLAAAGIVLLALMPALAATVTELRVRRLYDAALTSLGENRGRDYLQHLDRAAALAPHDAYLQHRAAAWLLERRHATSDRDQQLRFARDARERLERSLATGAHQEFAHFNLGWLLLELAQPEAAARRFAAAARLVPDKGGVYLGLGLAHHALGHRDAAVRCFALEIVNDPRQIAAPVWEVPALTPLRSAIDDAIRAAYRELRRTYPPSGVMETWTRWWLGEDSAGGQVPPGFSAASRAFAQALPEVSRNAPLGRETNTAWGELYTAWRNAIRSSDPSSPAHFLTCARGDQALAAALARRARQHAREFRAFLAAPIGDEPALVRTVRRQRTGYGILALHPEGPPPTDLYIVQENRLVHDFAGSLFPAKGWLPGQYLLQLLPAVDPLGK